MQSTSTLSWSFCLEVRGWGDRLVVVAVEVREGREAGVLVAWPSGGGWGVLVWEYVT